MPTFDLKKITAVKGKQTFYQLTIDDVPDYTGLAADDEEGRNNRKRGVLDEFEANLEKKYKSKMKTIYTYMDMVANGMHVNGAKHHEMTDRPASDPIKDYEFKNGPIRIYCFKLSGNKIITYCSYKNKQEKHETAAFRALKLRVAEQLENYKF